MIQVNSNNNNSNLYSNPPPPILNQGPVVNTANVNNAQQQQSFQPLQFKPFKPPDGEFDGKRLRKSVMRKTVDYNSSVIQMLEARIWQRDERDRPALPPDICYASHMLPPPAYLTNPINAVVSKFVRSSTNKAKCPIFCLAWTPEGRRLVTGASSGEFTLWNGLTFNFETILQAHESSVRAMIWSHNDQWMVTGDTSGYVKYWQSNMNNVKMFQAHKDPVRGLSFSPSDLKLATGSDDGTVRIWDFFRCQEERVLIGHGSDVKCVDWHPSTSLLASGSKDNQQPIKLWDPRSGSSLAQLHAHKSTVMDLKWNSNGTWLCSASRDHLLKLFDIRNFSTELQVFRGHKKEASSIAWHPQHEGLFASGGSDGSILFWHVGNDKEVGAIESAHDGIIWDLAWHPLGHLLCSGSNDHSSKFWTRNRPGDKMRDKYNLNTLPPGVVGDDCVDIDDIPVSASYMPSAAIPGMGPDDKVEAEPEPKGPETIPGLDFDSLTFDRFLKKTPYAKPIPKTFQAAWNAAGGLDEDMEDDQSITSWVIVESENLFSRPANLEGKPVITDIGEELPPGSVPLSQIKADAIAYYGFYIPLPKVPGNLIQDAFAFNEEEETAITEITSDADFARKLIREKKGLYNPSANPGQEDVKVEDFKKENFHNKQANLQQNKHPPNMHPHHPHFNQQMQHSIQMQHNDSVEYNNNTNNVFNPAEIWNSNFKRLPGNFQSQNFNRANNLNHQQLLLPNHAFQRSQLDFNRGVMGQGTPAGQGRFPFSDAVMENRNMGAGDRQRDFGPSDDMDSRGRSGFFGDEGRGRGFYMEDGGDRDREYRPDDRGDRSRNFRGDDHGSDRPRGGGGGGGRSNFFNERGRNFNNRDNEEHEEFEDRRRRRRRVYNNREDEADEERLRGRDQPFFNRDDARVFNNGSGGGGGGRMFHHRDGPDRGFFREGDNENFDKEEGELGRRRGGGGGGKNFSRSNRGRDFDENSTESGGDNRWRDQQQQQQQQPLDSNNHHHSEEDGFGSSERRGSWRDRQRRVRGRGFHGGTGKGRSRGGGRNSDKVKGHHRDNY